MPDYSPSRIGYWARVRGLRWEEVRGMPELGQHLSEDGWERFKAGWLDAAHELEQERIAAAKKLLLEDLKEE